MTSTFATQFSSGNLKVDMQGCGSTPAMGNLQMGLWNKRGLQRKEKISV